MKQGLKLYMFWVAFVASLGGLLFGTLITLLFIPVLYAMFFGIKNQKSADEK